MNTIPNQVVDGRRRRRVHSDEFKADVVAACMHPGVSIAAVAMANGINANLLRRWVHIAEMRTGNDLSPAALPAHKRPKAQSPSSAFVPMQLPAPALAPATEIRIELRRGATAISVSWPVEAAPACAAWMRELLR